MLSGRLLGEDVLGIFNREKARDTLETLCVSAGLGVPQEEDKAVVWGGRKLSRWMNISTSLMRVDGITAQVRGVSLMFTSCYLSQAHASRGDGCGLPSVQ